MPHPTSTLRRQGVTLVELLFATVLLALTTGPILSLQLRTSQRTRGSRVRLRAATRADALLAWARSVPFTEGDRTLHEREPGGEGPRGPWLLAERVTTRAVEDGLSELVAAVTWSDGKRSRTWRMRTLRRRPTHGLQAPEGDS